MTATSKDYLSSPIYRDLMVIESHRDIDQAAKPFYVVNHHAINAFTIIATFRFRREANNFIDDFAKWDREYLSSVLPYSPVMEDSINVHQCRLDNRSTI